METTATRHLSTSASTAAALRSVEKERCSEERICHHADDYDGLASLLVVALRAAILLPIHEAPSEKACSRCESVLPLDSSTPSLGTATVGAENVAVASECPLANLVAVDGR
jgi:hypothetical protein